MDNLKKGDPHRFTKENASEMGKRGNEASQAAHEKNVRMSAIAKTVSSSRVKAAKIRKALHDLGVTDEQQVNAAVIVKAVFEAAAAGNIPAVDKWEELLDRASAEPRADRIQHHSSYLDLDEPDWLGERFIAEAEDLKQRNERRYRHEYLGEAVGTGGNVFENLELRTITEEEMKTFGTFYQGVDWGWFPDPYAFIRLCYDPARETVYLLDEHVGNNMTNEETAAWIRTRGYDSAPIICDSAEPKSVSDYWALGLGAKPCTKGKGSVDYGMKWLQGRTIVIDQKRTPHAYEEFVHYEYDRDRDGNFITG